MSLTIGELVAYLKLDDKQFTPAIENSGKAMQTTEAKTKQLGTATERLALQIDKQKIEHKLLATQIEKGGDSTGRLGAKMKLLAHDIGANESKLTGMKNDLNKVGVAAQNTEAKVSRLSSGMKKAIAWVGGAVAFGTLARFLVEAGKAAQEDATRFAALGTIMKNQGQASDALVKSMEGFIDAEKLGAEASEEELVPALARLQAATKDVTKTQELANVAEDVAVGRHIDLTAAATALAKGSQGTLTALQRMGVAIKDSAGKALSFDEILANLKATYGGAAAAVANADPWKKLAAAWEVLKEKLGRTLLPAINKMMPKITEFVVKLGNAIESGDWGGIGEGIGTAIGDGMKAVAPVVGKAFWSAIWDSSKASGKAQGQAEGAKIAQDFGDGFNAQMVKLAMGGAAFMDMYTAGLTSKSMSWLMDKLFPPRGVSFGLGQEVFTPYIAGVKAATSQTSAFAATIDTILGNAGLLRIKLGKDNVLSELAALAQIARDQMKELYNTMSGRKAGMTDPAQVWDDAAGSFKRYIRLMKEHMKDWATFDTNMRTLAAQFGLEYGSEVINKLATMQPDFIAGLVGQKETVQRQVLDGIKAGLPGGDKVYGLGYGIGGGLGKSIKAGIGTIGVTFSPINVSALWHNVQSMFTNNPIHVSTSAGSTRQIPKNALGGVFSRATLGVFGEDGAEAIVPLTKPARAAQVMAEAGLGMDDSRIVGKLEELINAYRSTARELAITAHQVGAYA